MTTASFFHSNSLKTTRSTRTSHRKPGSQQSRAGVPSGQADGWTDTTPPRFCETTEEKWCQYETVAMYRCSCCGVAEGLFVCFHGTPTFWVPAVVVQPLSLTVPDISCLVLSVLIFPFSLLSLLLFPPLPLCFALSNCPTIQSSGPYVGFHSHIEDSRQFQITGYLAGGLAPYCSEEAGQNAALVRP